MGHIKAEAIGGGYPLNNWIKDALFLLFSCGICAVVYLALKFAFKRLTQAKRKLIRFLGNALLLSTTLLLIVPFFLASIQLNPFRTSCVRNPGYFGMKFESVQIQSNSGALSAWYVFGNKSRKPIVLITHGYGSSKDNFLPMIQRVQSCGYDVFILDFPGHGDSEGGRSTLGISEAEDIKAGYDWLKSKYPDRPICAIGYSMGGAAVIRAAALYDIFDVIIVDSSYSRLRNVFDKAYPLFWPLNEVNWQETRFWGWVWSGYDFNKNQPDEYVSRIASRLKLIIHSKDDKMIPYDEAIKLHALTGRQSELWLLTGYNHVQNFDDGDYSKKIDKYLNIK